MLCPTCQRSLVAKTCPHCSAPTTALASSLVLALTFGLGAGGCNESDDGDSTDDVLPDAGADEYAGPDGGETTGLFMDTTDEETTGDSSETSESGGTSDESTGSTT